MDTFLHLDADVYDGDLASEPIDLETRIQRHIVETSQGTLLFADQAIRPVEVEKKALELDEQERQHYLQRELIIEKEMQEANNEVQQRLDTMKRILNLKDPMEQLVEYLTHKQEDRRDKNVNVVEDLLQCANRMMNIEDSEVAALGAFFFLCDRQRPQARRMTLMLPVVAAMLEASRKTDPHTPF
ncbi:hypothetical protein DD238_005173 [Peronospora effusa]|uniref:Uncharacterized protein n=1 Tax=Peronospora effusa TaxID=542832 RepID=A0A3M6V9I9_9STRA|nr:hypothetical protein DD238_005173 [Peronospora effusa]